MPRNLCNLTSKLHALKRGRQINNREVHRRGLSFWLLPCLEKLGPLWLQPPCCLHPRVLAAGCHLKQGRKARARDKGPVIVSASGL